MRIRLFIEQLALIGALSSLVLAALWAHVKPLATSLWSRVGIVSSILDWKQNQAQHHHYHHLGDQNGGPKMHKPPNDHPRLSGQSLRRPPNMLAKSHWSLNSYGQSAQVHLPTVGGRTGQHSSNIMLGPSTGGGGGGGSFVQDARRLAASQNASQSSISFILFTASMIALIIFTLMKLLSAKFGPNNNNNRHTTRLYDKSLYESETDCADHDQSNSGKATTARKLLKRSQQQQRQQQRARRYCDDNDLSYYDKKKLSKLSREERTRKLILRHGGKSLSNAIRLIISEFERQKHQLIAQSDIGDGNGDGAADLDQVGQHEALNHCCCDCSCHLDGTSEGDMAKRSQEPVDSGQTSTISDKFDGRKAVL